MPKAKTIVTDYVFVRDPEMYERTRVDVHGNRWTTYQDGVRTLGRRVVACAGRDVIASVSAVPYRYLLSDRSQRSMQGWADGQSARMKQQYGTAITKSSFASRHQLHEAGMRTVQVGGNPDAIHAHIGILVAQALTKAKVGSFGVRIDTDRLSNRVESVDRFEVFGVGEGTGMNGGWQPYYDLRAKAETVFSALRNEGASFQAAVDAIPFARLAQDLAPTRG